MSVPSESMPGRRVSDDTPHTDYEPGDYGRYRSLWMVCLPSGVKATLDYRWTVVEHDDGSTSIGSAGATFGFPVTVSPSLHDAPDGWHGWLERGYWVSVR